MGVLTLNSVYEIANRGGGIMIGTDHNCCQTDANAMLNALIPGASFSGIEAPSTDGVFYGAQLLNNLEATAPINVLNHWSTEGSQGIPPTGDFLDFLGNSVTLYSQVDIHRSSAGPGLHAYRPAGNQVKVPPESATTSRHRRTMVVEPRFPNRACWPCRASACSAC